MQDRVILLRQGVSFDTGCRNQDRSGLSETGVSSSDQGASQETGCSKGDRVLFPEQGAFNKTGVSSWKQGVLYRTAVSHVSQGVFADRIVRRKLGGSIGRDLSDGTSCYVEIIELWQGPP